MPEILAENVDRIVTVEMRAPGIPRGVMPHLYEHVRRKVGMPLSLKAARVIKENLKKGDNVFVVTGAGDPIWLPKGETDGPLGAVAIARSLDLAFSARPIFVCTKGYEAPIEATAEAAGLSLLPWEHCLKRNHATLVEKFPIEDVEPSFRKAEELISKYKPSMLIAVEVKGPNCHGDLAYMSGKTATGEARLDTLFEVAHRMGIPTIGIGDGGNEIGFGDFIDEVYAVHPRGERIACIVKTDALVVGAISNWGAYGLEATLSGLLGNGDIMHSSRMEEDMLRAAVSAGAGDGIYTQQLLMVDGLDMEVHLSLIDILGHMIRTTLRGVNYSLS